MEHDSLTELAKLRTPKLVLQFRLSRQNNLQQFTGRVFQVKQQAQLVQCLQRKSLCLVENQNRTIAHGILRNQPFMQNTDQITLPASTEFHAKIAKNKFKQFDSFQSRVEHIRRGNFSAPQRLQDGVNESGLARARFPGQYQESLPGLQTIKQFLFGCIVSRRGIVKARIRRDVKRVLPQAKIAKETLVGASDHSFGNLGRQEKF